MSCAGTFSLAEMQQALGAVEEGNDEIGSLKKKLQDSSQQLVDVVLRVAELLRQVNLKHQRAISIGLGEAGEDLQKAEELVADIGNMRNELVALKAKATELSTTIGSISQQIQMFFLKPIG